LLDAVEKLKKLKDYIWLDYTFEFIELFDIDILELSH
jgi:hypothetical protein